MIIEKQIRPNCSEWDEYIEMDFDSNESASPISLDDIKKEVKNENRDWDQS